MVAAYLHTYAGQFYAQERVIVNRFNEEGLPSAKARLEAAVGAPIQIQCDLVSVLAQCSLQGRRLPTAKTIVNRTKYTDKAVIVAGKGFGAAKKATEFAFGAAQATYAKLSKKASSSSSSSSEIQMSNTPNIVSPTQTSPPSDVGGLSSVHAEAEAIAAAEGKPPIDGRLSERGSGDSDGASGDGDGDGDGDGGDGDGDGAAAAVEGAENRSGDLEGGLDTNHEGGAVSAASDGSKVVDAEEQVYDSPNVLQPLVEAFEYGPAPPVFT